MHKLVRRNGAVLVLGLGLVLAAGPAHAVGPVEITPQVGLGKPTGQGSSSYGVGLDIGLAVGARLSPLISLDGQLGYNRMNLDRDVGPIDFSIYMARILFVPAVHAVQDKFDFSLGPTLGLFRLAANVEAGGMKGSASVRGYQLGLQAGMMIAASPTVSVGPVFSFARLWATKACADNNTGGETCNEPKNDDEGFWNLGLGARF